MKSQLKFLACAVAISAITPPVCAQTAPADAPISAREAAALRQELAELRAQIEALKSSQAAVSAVPAKPVQASVVPAGPTWKGAPQFEDKASGFSFKPRGRIQYDAGFVSEPGALATRNLGFNSRIRRIRLGAEGTIPGGFGYKVDVDFANASVGFGDAFLSYASKNKHFGARLGNQEPLDGLDQITSSNYVTFTERAQFNDAFLNTRRLGAVVGYYPSEELRAEAGLFTAHSIDSSLDNDGWIGAARLVYAPEIGGGRLHVGLNYQHREFQSNNAGTASASVGAPSTNQLARYRARPFTQLTDVRFVDTGSFAAKGDDIFGVELAGVRKSFYFASEAQFVKTRSYDAGDIEAGLDAFSGGNGAVVATGNPGFFGAYAEIGYFLTGETRGYKEGAWGRTKVLKPLGKGGSGAFQIAARVDHLDLDTGKLKNGLTNNFATGATSLAAVNSRLGRGGTQTGYLLGLNWYPNDYVRFMLNYGHAAIQGGPLAVTIDPLSAQAVDSRNFGVDLFALRAQLDF